MQITSILLAQMSPETAQDIHKIYEMLEPLPASAFKIMWALIIVIAAAVITIFLRQRKIAQNQVELAQLIKELIVKDK